METSAYVVSEAGGPFELTEVSLDEPRADEVLVRVVATGVCHTDLSLRDNLPAEMFPRVFGHEGAGVVEQVGSDVTGIAAGDKVLMSFRSCRTCPKCQAGEVGYCTESFTLNYFGFRGDGSTTHQRDGSPVYGSFFGQSSMGAHAIAYADNCVVLPAEVAEADLPLLAPFGCGFQTGAGTVLNLMTSTADSSLVVFGCGAVGLSALAAAQGMGQTVAVDLSPERLAVAERYGAHPVNPNDLPEGQAVHEVVHGLTGGGATYAIDTTALSAVVSQAQASLAPQGLLVALGLGDEQYTIDAVDLLSSGKVIRSSIEGEADPLDFIPRLLQLRADGSFDVDELVKTYPHTELQAAIDDVTSGRVVKPVLTW